MSNGNPNNDFDKSLSEEMKELDNFLAEESLLQQLKRHREPIETPSTVLGKDSLEGETATMNWGQSTPDADREPLQETIKAKTKETKKKKKSKGYEDLSHIPVVKPDYNFKYANPVIKRYFPAPKFTNLILFLGLFAIAITGLTWLAIPAVVLGAAVTVFQEPSIITRGVSIVLTLIYAASFVISVF